MVEGGGLGGSIAARKSALTIRVILNLVTDEMYLKLFFQTHMILVSVTRKKLDQMRQTPSEKPNPKSST